MRKREGRYGGDKKTASKIIISKIEKFFDKLPDVNIRDSAFGGGDELWVKGLEGATSKIRIYKLKIELCAAACSQLLKCITLLCDGQYLSTNYLFD